MKNQRYEDVASERIHLIMPLFDERLDLAARIELRRRIAEKSGLSERTIRRYESAYVSNGFQGLRPKERRGSTVGSISDGIMEEAIKLRREVPSRSVSQIIRILEWEGLIPERSLPRSTLQERLSKAGYGSSTMRSYQSKGMAARRFQANNRGDLWHSDIKYGPVLAIGPKGTFKQVYLVVFLDDATRYVLHAAFYDSLDKSIVRDAFKESLIHHGIPKAVYFDNGTQYKNDLIRRACAKLGIRLIHAKPYSPESTGKVERFNRHIDDFLAEARLDRPQTLEELNRQLDAWLDTCYQHKGHSALEGGISPDRCYRSSTKPMRFLDHAVVNDAFLHSEERKVDKTGCISLNSRKYEVGPAFIGMKVTVVFDPGDTSVLTIETAHHQPFTVKELKIGPKAGKRPDLPERLQPIEVSHSRLLKACREKSAERQEKVKNAISYSRLIGGGSDV